MQANLIRGANRVLAVYSIIPFCQVHGEICMFRLSVMFWSSVRLHIATTYPDKDPGEELRLKEHVRSKLNGQINK